MNAAPSKHPPREFLQAFGLGKLDEVAATKVSQHLETCEDCKRQVAELSADSLLDHLRKANASVSTPVPGNTLTPSAPAKQPEPTGVPAELLNNAQYEIIRELGSGGMGVVYLAKNKLMDRLEVLKVISTAMVHKSGALDRFLREIRSAAALSHDNVVKAHSALQFGELLVFAMEYVEGDDLAKVVKSQGQLPIANACFYARQVALGLQHAYEKNMVHRDIKPHNLILAREGKKHVVKILDFGLAKATSEKKADYGLTGEGRMLGTPDYMAPEQIQDAATADIRADIYSLGCTLYYFLTGGTPFSANSLYGLLQAHQTQEAKSVNLVRPEAPVELGAIVAKMMAKDPAKRFQKPSEVAQALTPFIKPGPKGPLSLAPSAKAAPPRAELVTKRAQTMVAEPAPAPAPIAAAFAFEAAPKAPTPAPKKADAKPPQRRRSMALIAVAFAAVGLIALGAVTVFFWQTPNGVVRIEINDPEIEFALGKDGATFKGLDKKDIRISPGEHGLHIKRGDLEFDTDKFILKKGETITLKIEWLKEGKLQVVRDGQVIGNKTAPAPVGDGFVSLFDGKTLKGWLVESGDPQQWKVEDGAILGTRQGDQSPSALLSDRDYGNFILRFDYRPVEAHTVGWVVYHAAVGETEAFEGQIQPMHPNVGLGRKNRPGVEPVGRVWWGLGRPLPANIRVELKDPNEWNGIEVTVRGNELRMVVNGQEVTRANLDEIAQIPDAHEGFKRTSGRVGFQAWDDGSQFRNIRIKELPPGATDKKPDPPLSVKRFRAQDPRTTGKWSVVGKHLVQTSLDPGARIFFGDLDWTDYDFSVEAQRIQGNDQFALWFRDRGEWQNACLFALGWLGTTNTLEQIIDGKNYQLKEPPPGGMLKRAEWYTARVEVRGQQAKCFLDGRLVFSFDAVQHLAGGVGLRTWATAYAFRNIKVTTPDGKVLLEGLPDFSPPPPPKVSVAAPKPGRFPMPAEFVVNGVWEVDNGELVLVRDTVATGSRIAFGDKSWTDYDFSVDAKRTAGNDGAFGLMARVRPGYGDSCLFAVAGRPFPPHQHHLNCPISSPVELASKPGAIKTGEWYTALVRYRGNQVECFLNGVEQFDMPTKPPPAGCVGLATWQSSFRFRNIKVTTPDGKVLLEGLPDISPPPPAKVTANGFVPLFNGKDLTGWQTKPIVNESGHNSGTKDLNAWKIENGSIVGRTGNFASLRSERDDYGDFHLRVEAMAEGGAGQVLFRFPNTGKPGAFMAQISNSGQWQTGSLMRKSMRILECPWWPIKAVSPSPAPANTWAVLEIIAVGDQITVKVNGATTAEARQLDGEKSGAIMLYADRTQAVKFRKVEIKALP